MHLCLCVVPMPSCKVTRRSHRVPMSLVLSYHCDVFLLGTVGAYADPWSGMHELTHQILMLQPQHMMPSQLTRADPTQHCAVRQDLLVAVSYSAATLVISEKLFTFFLSLPLFLFACTLRKGSGSYVHVSPRPCSSAVDGPGLQPTDRRDHTTQCVVRALMPTLAHRHRMCVIAKGLGCLRTRSRTWSFLGRLRIQTHVFHPYQKNRHFSHGDTCLAPCPCVIDPRRADVPRARRLAQRICISPL